MRYFVTEGDADHEVTVEELEDGSFRVTVDGRELHANLERLAGEDIFSLVLDGRSYELLISDVKSHTTVVHHGQGVDLRVESERERNARLIAAEGDGGGGEVVRAVMPGIVVSVAVQEGDTVKGGQALLVLEAMKMENEIRCAAAGLVTRIAVTKGQTVNGGDVLVEIQAGG
jgi:glutaconyl-CoA/methylmalonyl-CoA decarboxylase subunit gamma